ncbi:hypothetical protein ACMFMF_004570 [Clarireedia jacksonii]
MRAFVEVDFGVRMKCLDAGLALKREFSDRCYVQICVFAQDPIFTLDKVGESMPDLLEEAIKKPGVEVLGSTPYVEKNSELMEMNIQWTVEKAKLHKLHLDFHIDYNLDPSKYVSILSAIEMLHRVKWPTNRDAEEYRTVVFGHCTRLTLFDTDDWQNLRRVIGELPISFVGLPTSDLFMMGRPGDAGGSTRVRGTLQVLEMIKKYGLNVTMGINNVGNAFTPQGSCDPMSLASLGVGVYQAGTKADAELILECVSTRARAAIGLGKNTHLEIESGGPADFVAFNTNEPGNFRARKSIQELVYDAGHCRTTVFRGKVIAST